MFLKVPGVRRRSRWAQASVAALLTGLAVAPSAYAQEATSRFAIPEQPLSSGLLALGRQARISIAAPSELVAGKSGKAVQGELTVRVALARMLEGSGLRFEFVGANAVRVLPETAAPQLGAAGEAAGEASQLTELVVLGTRIKGAAPVGSELVSLSRRDIDLTGRATVTDLMKTIPQIQTLGATEGLNGRRGQGQIDDKSAATSVNLRGLGADATLVLVNGRRVAPTAGGAFVDISQFPLSIIDRVEILPDGASALYGSDAIGGVVNFVLRKGHQGADSEVRYGVGSGFHEYSAGQTLGLDWSSGSAILAYEYYSRTRLAASKRSYYQSDLRAFGGSDFRDPLASNPGNIFSGGHFYAVPRNQDGTRLKPSDLVIDTQNLQNAQKGADILPSQERNSVVVSINQDLTPHVHLYLDGFYSTREFEKSRSGGSAKLTVPKTNPFFVNPNPAATTTDVYYSFVNDFQNRIQGRAQNYTVTAGAKFDLPKAWTGEFYGTAGQDKEADNSFGGPNNIRLAQALADPNPATAFNPFGDGSHTAAATLAKVAGSIRYRKAYDIRALNLGANGELFELPGGAVRMAIGADYRTEKLTTSSLIDQDQATPYHLPEDGTTERNITAGYAELLVPIFGEKNARPGFERLQLSLAVRSERYSDFGSTTNPKIGFTWKPIDSLSLRGSWGTSFKAPRLEQLNEAQNAWVATFFPNAAAVVGSPTTPFPGFSNTLVLIGAGNKHLQPETAETWSVGADFQPATIPGFRAGLTYFAVRYENRISVPTVEQVSALLAAGSAVDDLVVARKPTQAQVDAIYSLSNFVQGPKLPANQVEAILNFSLANFGAVEEEGLDANAAYQFANAYGTFSLDGSLTYLTKYQVQRVNGQPFVKALNTISNPNRLRGRVSVNWLKGPVQAGVSANYIGSYTNNLMPVSSRVSAWTTVDAHLGYTFDDASGLRRGVSVLLDVENLLDSDPPFVNNLDSKVGYDPELGNPRGRTVSLTLRKSW